MSYILDALKKADAERARERSVVPGLDAQPDAALGDGPSRRGGGSPWRALAIGAVVLVAALLAWFGLSSRDEPTVIAAAPAAASPAAVPLPALMAAPAVPTASAQPAASAAVTSAPPPAVAPAASMAPTMAAAPAARPIAAAAPAKPPATPPPAAKTATEADTRLPTVAQLPAELRAALPPLGVSGAVYAPQPSGRMVFLNGQVLREGSEVAAGLVVEHIGPEATVLSFRGTRFQVRH